jgi:hypothetical protein
MMEMSFSELGLLFCPQKPEQDLRDLFAFFGLLR